MNETKVKICGITNLDDARVAVEAGAYALGFNFYPRSPRYIRPEDARRIIAQLPSSVLTVGVFVNEAEPETVARTALELNLGAVQLHGDESPAYCRALKNFHVIKALRVGAGFASESVVEYETEAILLDAFDGRERGGTGRTFDWEIARRVCELVPKLFLAGGLSPENVGQAIQSVKPFAVDACSRLEIEPGRKDPSRVRAFLAAAHVKP